MLAGLFRRAKPYGADSTSRRVLQTASAGLPRAGNFRWASLAVSAFIAHALTLTFWLAALASTSAWSVFDSMTASVFPVYSFHFSAESEGSFKSLHTNLRHLFYPISYFSAERAPPPAQWGSVYKKRRDAAASLRFLYFFVPARPVKTATVRACFILKKLHFSKQHTLQGEKNRSP